MQRLIMGKARGTLNTVEVLLEDVPHSDVLEVIGRCLKYDPQERPTFKDIEASLTAIMGICLKEEQNKSQTTAHRSLEQIKVEQAGEMAEEMKEFESPWSGGSSGTNN